MEIQSQDQVIVQRLRDTVAYTEKTNELVGLFSFATAVACVSTENPRFYALLSLALLLIAWSSLMTTYQRRLKLLRDIGHQDLKPTRMIKRTAVALIGYLFLFLVVLGYFDRYGFNPNPSIELPSLRSTSAGQ
jgi:hypothetical protein